MAWQPIETLEPNTLALVWREYEDDGRQIAVDSYFWRETIEEEVQSETTNAKGRRKVIQETTKREREWRRDGWGATYWMPLPNPPAAPSPQVPER